MKAPLIDFEEYWERVPDHINKVIEDAVENKNDIAPIIIPAKDGKILAYINPIGDRDQYLKIMAMIIQGMEPDEIIFVTDAYVSSQQFKHDGTPWELGEMSQAYLDMTENADLVSENVCVMRMDRLGNVMAYSVDYRRTEDDKADIKEPRVFGVDEEDPNQGSGMGGYMIDQLRSYFAKETYRQWAKRNEVSFLPNDDMSEEEFSIFMTGMIIKQALIPLGCSALMMIHGASNANKVYDYFKDDEAEGQYKVMDQSEYNRWIGEEDE